MQGGDEPPCWRQQMCSPVADIADLPIASACDDPVDHFLVALCPRCKHPVDAVCPKCLGHVEASGAGDGGRRTEDGGQKTESGVKSCLSQSEFYRRFLQLLQGARNSKFT